MTLKIWKIELRVDFDGPEKEEVMLKAVRHAARHLLTTANLIADKRAPQIAVQSDDMFEGTEVVALFADGETPEDELA